MKRKRPIELPEPPKGQILQVGSRTTPLMVVVMGTVVLSTLAAIFCAVTGIGM